MYTHSLASSVLVVSCKSCRLVLEQNIFVSPSNNTNIAYKLGPYVIAVNKKHICTQDVYVCSHVLSRIREEKYADVLISA